MRPSNGRWFSPDEERKGDPVAVLGWTAWNRDFGADPDVLGRTLIIGGTAVQVIGVGPRTLSSSVSTALITCLWMPIGRAGLHLNSASAPSPRLLERRDELFLQVADAASRHARPVKNAFGFGPSYRTRMTRVFVVRALRAAVARARGEVTHG